MRGIKIDGGRLRVLREEKIWLISDLSEASGIHRNTISRLERGIGTATPDTIHKLAGALRVNPGKLVASSAGGAGRGLPRVIGG
jgi:transcriptional regulator with XRE-family HTH domain